MVEQRAQNNTWIGATTKKHGATKNNVTRSKTAC